MRVARALMLAAALVAALAGSASGDTPLFSNQDYQQHLARNLGTPLLGSDALRLQDIAVGSCILKGTGVNSPTFVCGVAGTDYQLPMSAADGSILFPTATTIRLRDVTGLSVVGRSGSSAGVAQDIPCSVAGTFLGNLTGTSVACAAVPWTSLAGIPVDVAITKGLARTRYVDYDGGSDASDCLTTTTPCKTVQGVVATVPSNGAGGSLLINGLPRAGGAAYLMQDGVTAENLSSINQLVGYSFVQIIGDWYKTGSTPPNGAIIVAGTSSSGYDLTGTPTTLSASVQLHGGGSAALSAEPALIGYRWRFSATTTTVALRNISRMIIANTSSSVTWDTALTATPVAGDTGTIETPGLAFGAVSISDGPRMFFTGVSFTGGTFARVPSVSLSFVHGGGFNMLDIRTLSMGLQSKIAAMDMTRVVSVGLSSTAMTSLRFSSVEQITAARFYASGNLEFDGCTRVPPGFTTGTDPSTLPVQIGDVPGSTAATSNSPSRISTTSGTSAIWANHSNLRIGRINIEVTGSFSVPTYGIRFAGNGNALYIDGMTANNSPLGLAGIIDASDENTTVYPAHGNTILFGPNQVSLTDGATGVDDGADIHVSSQSPLSGLREDEYTLQLNTLSYTGAIVDGNGNRWDTLRSYGSGTVYTYHALWDPNLVPPVGPGIANDQGRFRVVRASTGGLVKLAAGDSSANWSGIVGVNLDSLPDPPRTNYDGSAIVAPMGQVIPIFCVDASPTVPGPVYLGPSGTYPTGVVTTVKPATNAIPIGWAMAVLANPFSETTQYPDPPNPNTITGTLLRVKTFNGGDIAVGGDVSGVPGDQHVNALHDSGGTKHPIGAIASSQILVTDSSGNVVTSTAVPLSVVGAPTGTGFAHVTSGAWDPAARAVDVSGADATGTLAAGRFPALTGPVTTVAGSLATALNVGAGASVTGLLPLANQAAPSGSGIPHVTSSAWDSSVYAATANQVQLGGSAGGILGVPELVYNPATHVGGALAASSGVVAWQIGNSNAASSASTSLQLINDAGNTFSIRMGSIASGNQASWIGPVGSNGSLITDPFGIAFASSAFGIFDAGGGLELPTVTGVPTTPPNVLSGSAPTRVDSVDDRLYVYRSGWKIYGQYDGSLSGAPGLLKTAANGVHSIATVQASGSSGGGDVQGPGAYITALSGPVVATGPGSAAATLNLGAVGVSGTPPCSSLQVLTGDVTSSGCTTTLTNIPSGTPVAGFETFAAIAAPAAPTTGHGNGWFDSTAQTWMAKSSAGTVSHLAQTKTCPAGQWMDAEADTGAFTCAQIDYSNLTSTPTSLPPSGPAGGALAGSSYPNPSIANGVIVPANFAAFPALTLFGNPTGSSATPTTITLGTGLSLSGGSLNVTVAGGADALGSYWVSGASHAPANAVNWGLLGNGVHQQTTSGSVSTPSVFTSTPGAMVVGAATGGGLANDANFSVNPSTHLLTATGSVSLQGATTTIGAWNGIAKLTGGQVGVAAVGTDIFYQTVHYNGIDLPQAAKLGFSNTFALSNLTGITQVDLGASGVSAGSYTTANITVGADGRITAASNGGGAAFYQTIHYNGIDLPQAAKLGFSNNFSLSNLTGVTQVDISYPTGILKGSGGSAVAATAGTDYVQTVGVSAGQLVNNGTAANPILGLAVVGSIGTSFSFAGGGSLTFDQFNRMVSGTSSGSLPLDLLFTYGGGDGQTALPDSRVTVGNPDFWLRPNSGFEGSGSSGFFAFQNQVWEYDTGGTYGSVSLRAFVYQCGISTTGGVNDLTLTVTKNGVNTGVAVVVSCPNTISSNVDYAASGSVSFGPTDRVGVRATVTNTGVYSSGAFRATVHAALH